MFKKEEHRGDEIETVIGPSVKVEGDFVAAGDIIIEGVVSGRLITERDLRLGQNGRIFANVDAANAVLAGEVQGNVKVDGALELTESAKVFGDIKASILVMASGAVVHGKCQVGQLKKSKEVKAEAVKAKDPQPTPEKVK